MEYVLAKLFLEQKEMSEAEVMENVRTYYECLLEMCGLEPDMNLNSNQELIPEVISVLRHWCSSRVLSCDPYKELQIRFSII